MEFRHMAKAAAKTITRGAQLRVASDQITNGAEATIEAGIPYVVNMTLEGSASLLFHRWNCDAVEAKGAAAKGSAAKKTDDLESYVYRDEGGQLALPGEYVRQSIINAAKFKQDPRSPRKSAMDLFKAGVLNLTDLASLGVDTWDFEDRRRVSIQRNGVTRVRPAMRAGWKAHFQFMVQTPEYIGVDLLRSVVDDAGRLVGVGDFRPTFGRFAVANWSVGLG
jgi:hypothetical protein